MMVNGGRRSGCCPAPSSPEAVAAWRQALQPVRRRGAGLSSAAARALEVAARRKVMVLDMTGTVTEGCPRVREFINRPPWGDAALLELAAAVETGLEHVPARAVLEFARSAGVAAGAQSRDGLGGHGHEVHLRGGQCLAVAA
ncbi:MAG: hypothetical protein H7831_01375 [Magnetococcus sp. WYHC-3]